MPDRVTDEVLSAIMSGSTNITRRLEIYESDGETLWTPGEARMITGNVTVDYSRAERRTIDVTLDNKDDLLRHDPNEFWYDKILKAYRGVQYQNTRKTPRIAVLYNQSPGPNYLYNELRRLGFNDLTDKTNATQVADFDGYDIVLAYSHVWAIPSDIAALLESAYNAGFNIFTSGNDNTEVQIPLIGSNISKTDGAIWSIDPVEWDTPVSTEWESSGSLGTDTGNLPTSATNGTQIVGTYTWSGNLTYPVLIKSNNIDARWFHFQPQIPTSGLQTPMRRLWSDAVNWLYGFGDTRHWEVKIGEFLIDSINSDHFPKHIHVTGRDYTKKLLNVGFRTSTTFSMGLSIDNVVQGIALNGGITKFIGGAANVTLQAELSFDREAQRWQAIQDICTANGVEVYFDAEGYLVTRTFRDPVSSPTTVTLKAGADGGNLANIQKSSSDGELKNVVVVSAENPDLEGIFYQGVAINDEPNHPARVSRIGERTYFYSSSVLTSNEKCLETAKNFLKVMSLEEFEVNFGSICFPWLEGGDIAEFIDPEPGIGDPDRYLLSSFSIPLGLGPMTGNMKRVTIVGSITDIQKPFETEPETEGAA